MITGNTIQVKAEDYVFQNELGWETLEHILIESGFLRPTEKIVGVVPGKNGLKLNLNSGSK